MLAYADSYIILTVWLLQFWKELLHFLKILIHFKWDHKVSSKKNDRIGGVMVNVLASSVLDRGFEPRVG